MKKISFALKAAEAYGVNPAIILDYIAFFCWANHRKRMSIIDGKIWTYASVRHISESFPFFTDRQIRTAIVHLIRKGAIVTGEYNQKGYDKTKWYSPTADGWLNCSFDLNVRPYDKNVKPIPVDNIIETEVRNFQEI